VCNMLKLILVSAELQTEWETLQGRTTCVILLRTWKAISDRLQTTRYLSMVDHDWKFWARKQRTDISKYSFVNRTVTEWIQLIEGEIATPNCNTYSYIKRVSKVMTSEAKWRR
jgi:hypothetical protein